MKPATINRKRIVFALLVFILFVSPLLPLDRAGRPATVTAAQDGPAQPAANLVVTNLNDSGTGSLRLTIAAANPGDIITFAPGLTGMITLTSGELIINKNLTINGPGKEFLTVSGNNNSRVFNIQGTAVTINDLAIANGNANNDPNDSRGGGIFSNGNLTLGNVRVSNNTASDGGGIAITDSGSLSMSSSIVFDNTATGNGGGISYDSVGSTMTITGSTIFANMAPNGGGVHIGGGGPFPIAISSTTISNNTASNNGGGVFFIYDGTVNLTNSTLSNNSALTGGGIYHTSTGMVSLKFSTLTLNTATVGGGIFQESGNVTTLSNTIVAQNNAPTGPNASGVIVSQGNNLIGNIDGATIGPGPDDQIGTPTNPINPNLTPLQDNGGGTLTHSPIEGSPAINTGNNIGAPPTDQRGLPRLLAGPVVDIGAVEFKTRLFSSLIITRIAPTVDPNKISVTALLTDSGTGQPLPARNVDLTFHRFFGDLDGDRDVATTDLDGFATGILDVGTSGATLPSVFGDFNGDAQFDFSQDFLGFSLSQPISRPQTPQGGGCQFLIFSADESFAANGGAGSFNVTTFPQDCDWTATSNDPWIQITSGAGGTGDGVVSYTVAAHTDPNMPRTGTITAAGLTFTVLQGAAFLDVPESNPFYTFIGKLSARSVTLGIGGGNYGPDDPVTRQQMAAFIIRALGDFDPPEPAEQRFDDVPPSNAFYRFIDQMAVRQITLGCTANMYCPLDDVNRQQMAAFLIRALGEPNPPVPFAQRFTDVASSNFFYNFIDRLAVRRVTLGCTADMYCPEDSVTRGQMAAFLVRAFNL